MAKRKEIKGVRSLDEREHPGWNAGNQHGSLDKRFRMVNSSGHGSLREGQGGLYGSENSLLCPNVRRGSACFVLC